MVLKRPNYFPYQFLREQDFKDEQEYHIEARRRHNNYAASPFRPALGEDKSRFNGLPQTHLVGKDHALRKRRPERE